MFRRVRAQIDVTILQYNENFEHFHGFIHYILKWIKSNANILINTTTKISLLSNKWLSFLLATIQTSFFNNFFQLEGNLLGIFKDFRGKVPLKVICNLSPGEKFCFTKESPDFPVFQIYIDWANTALLFSRVIKLYRNGSRALGARQACL